MAQNTCTSCNDELENPILCVSCKNPFHKTCGIYLVKSPLDEECSICSNCIQLPDIRKMYSIPPQQRNCSLHRSDSDSSLALKRKKGDSEVLHQEFILDALVQQNTSVIANSVAEASSAMIIENAPQNSSSETQISNNNSATSTSSIQNTFIYNPKPLLTVNDPKNATLEEISDVFNKNFNLIREDFNNLTNFCKIQQQFTTNCYNTINAYSNILKSHEEQLGNINSRIRTMEIDFSSNLMISGLDNIEDRNVDLKSMIVTLANYLNVNINKQDIRKVRVVKTPNNTSLVQATFYSSAHCLRLLDSKKSRGNITNSDVFKYSMSANFIYINELLPQDTHKLLTAARNLKRSFGLFRVWHNKGQIFLQITSNDRTILINNLKELDDLSKNLSSVSALQQQQLQNSQQQNFLQQPYENALPIQQQAQQQQQQQQYLNQQQFPQQQQNQLQQLQQQQLTHLAQPQNKFSFQQLNPQFRTQINRQQSQARSQQYKPNNQIFQRRQEMSRPQPQFQPTFSSQQDQQFNSTNMQNFNPQTFQNRPPNNNNRANYPNKNYLSYQNSQINTKNYRSSHITQPQPLPQYQFSQQIPLLRQPTFHHNKPTNSISTVPPIAPPPSLSTQSAELNLSQPSSQQSQE